MIWGVIRLLRKQPFDMSLLEKLLSAKLGLFFHFCKYLLEGGRLILGNEDPLGLMAITSCRRSEAVGRLPQLGLPQVKMSRGGLRDVCPKTRAA